MKLTKDQLVSAMERSYDYYSARAILGDVLDAAGLAGKAAFEAPEVERLCGVLAAQPRHTPTIEAIRALTGIGPAPAAAEPGVDKAAADKAAADKAAADKAAADKAAADKAAADKAAADKPAAEKPVEKKADADKPAEKKADADKPAEKKADADKPAEKKADADKPAEKKADADKPAEKKADAVKPVEKKAVKPEVVVALSGVPAGTTAAFVVGDHALIGAWKLEGGLALSQANGVWGARVALEPGTSLEFKFVAKLGDGEAWEGGDNHKLTAGPGETRFEATWQA